MRFHLFATRCATTQSCVNVSASLVSAFHALLIASVVSLVFASGNLALAVESQSTEPLPPEIAEASSEPQESMAAIRVPDGWDIQVWAAEPDVANVVAFDIDNQGRLYACETFRQNRGVTDNRGHDQEWLMADLSAKTVQDRIDYHKRLLGEGAITYAQHDDRIRRLADTDGDGKADESIVVADGFNGLEEGTGAGVLAIGNDVYYTCIPKLWKLVDQDGDGVTDERVVMSDGYGVRVAFRGHDMHGLIRGYDGRLYFSIGDRGYHVRTQDGKVLANAVSGAVFRCELDGSGLEVFASGMRNPQELAFNDLGDWFSVDNNSDSGDQARIIHILQDGDTGWRMFYQYLTDRGPFNRERTWEPQNDEQSAAIVPPVANFTDGPSGLAYYPGTGFGKTFQDTFFICDFRGGPSNSGIRSFRLETNGATYNLAEDAQPIWTCLATDLAFAPDGSMYVSDWVDGWDGLGKARIYRLNDPNHSDTQIVKEVQTLLSGDWSEQTVEQLADGLSHEDRRVRLHSQWTLAKRNEAATLIQLALNSEASTFARRHAIWGLGQISRQADSETTKDIANALTKTLSVEDTTLQCAAATIIGERGWKKSVGALNDLVSSENARVRYHAIDALGRLKVESAMEQVTKNLAKQDANDSAIRHATAMFYSRAASEASLSALTSHPSVQVRLAAVVALRRAKSGSVANFLRDAEERVVLEAARAIHDEPLSFATDALASLISNSLESDALARRVLNANFQLGTLDSAVNVAKFATRTETSEEMRLEAIEMLGTWATPDKLDRVLGDYRPLDPRDPKIAKSAMEPQIDLLMTAPEKVRLKAIEVASQLGIKKIAGELKKQITEPSRSDEAKGQALLALARIDTRSAIAAASEVPVEARGPLALASLTVLSQHHAKDSIKRIIALASGADTKTRQKAIDALAGIQMPEADQFIQSSVEQYINEKLSPEYHLNVVEAAQGRLESEQESRLAKYRSQIAEATPLGQWLDSMKGGDSEKGSELFFGKTELSCVRCHKVDRAGGEVGPNLTVIGKDRDSRYLLESICIPDAVIAKGFETAVIVDIDGKVSSGIVKLETDDYVELILNDGSQKRIPQDDIEARKKGKSSMPGDLTKNLSARELRDLVAYLSSLKVDPRADDDVE